MTAFKCFLTRQDDMPKCYRELHWAVEKVSKLTSCSLVLFRNMDFSLHKFHKNFECHIWTIWTTSLQQSLVYQHAQSNKCCVHKLCIFPSDCLQYRNWLKSRQSRVNENKTGHADYFIGMALLAFLRCSR